MRLAPRIGSAATLTLAVLAVGSAAAETFHFMQIEQVIAGVNGDTTAQAVQLRMRLLGQNFVGGQAKLFAHDAAGLNPVILCEFPNDLPNGNQGDRILITSPAFDAATSPIAESDFELLNLIPASYLAAGRLTFEDTFGTVMWSLAWGGSNYTGPTNGAFVNDPDGEFGPPFAGVLPSYGLQALLFQGSAGDPSSSNSKDYELTVGAAVFTNNGGEEVTVVGGGYCTGDLDGDGDTDLADLGILLADFGCPQPGPCAGDLDNDGDTDLADLGILLADFGCTS